MDIKDENELLDKRIKDLKAQKAKLRKEILELFKTYSDRISIIETAIDELENKKETLRSENRE